MIKAIVGYKMKVGADLQPILMKLRSDAMTFPGFINAENLVSVHDKSIIAVIYTWNKSEDWQAWETAKIKKRILQEAEPLLQEQPRITVYRVVPTTGW